MVQSGPWSGISHGTEWVLSGMGCGAELALEWNQPWHRVGSERKRPWRRIIYGGERRLTGFSKAVG
nr:hypothetical protein [uncultured Acetatifactor sp.]